ncbi:MAG: aminotransferase class V-fold PLP-dependent enzyme [Proteobacteria bacterium]|nr:aminotransferase class V-fold PLP-dependent enzyme [Pseudomonadota bacterium]MCK4868756.1 aminotransferase class V-fold PLP-dependent enzyme [Alphaproteobacteria bacterium]
MTISIPCQRDLFDIPDDVAWLNCAQMSPTMRSVAEAGEAAIRRKEHPWTISPVDFFTDSEIARGLFADVVNANPDEVAIVPSASYGMAIAAQNLSVGPDNRILVLDEQFPSNLYVWSELAKRTGARIDVVPRPDDDDWTAAILNRIGPDIAIAALPNNHWTDGGLIDLEQIGAALRDVGAALAVDATQSLGAMPFDVRRVRPDFLVAACYKWMLGPYSLGFLYVDPKHHAGQPIEHNWITRAGSEDFSDLVNYRDDYQPGARRFDMGERANFGLMPQAIAALRQILDWGVDNIQATLSARTGEIAARARGMGIDSVSQGLRAGHFLGLRFEGGVPEGLGARLAAEKIHISVRGASVRVTPHLYTNDEDIERFFDALGRAP